MATTRDGLDKAAGMTGIEAMRAMLAGQLPFASIGQTMGFKVRRTLST
jgi:hypothetical protein